MMRRAFAFLSSITTTHPALLASIVAAPLFVSGCAVSHDDKEGDEETVAEASEALISQVTNESFSDVGTLSAGYYDACVIKPDSTVQCWGRNVDYNPAPSPSGTFTQIDGGGDGSCGVRTDGTVSCWNQYWNFYGAPPAGTFSRVAVGDRHVCGLRTDGTVTCWGDNSSGQLNAPSGQFLGISSGYNTSCGIRTDGTLACWGYDGYYSFGLVNPPAGHFSQVTIGPWHACAIRADDAGVTCWGMYGTAQSPAGTFKKIVAGGGPGYDYDYTCGIRTDDTLACWYGWSSSIFHSSAGSFKQVAARYGACSMNANGVIDCFHNVYWPNPFGSVPAGLVGKTQLDTTFPSPAVLGGARCGTRVRLRSWKGDYLHRPDSPQGVTTWPVGIGNEWTVECKPNGNIQLRSWKSDYLHRPDSPQGVTTWAFGEWGVESLANGNVQLRSWKNDYLHRPDSPQGVTTWAFGEWAVEQIP